MEPRLPGNGLLGWLGRQVGHVARAVRTEPVRPPVAPGPKPAPAGKPEEEVTDSLIYRKDHVEEQPLPGQPGVILRRTIIDEVIHSAGPPYDGRKDDVSQADDAEPEAVKKP